jgi:methanogenic corrinoid protein MtbC1
MWERRYGFPVPHRTDSGVRSYLPADVERLTLVVRALKLGYRVGETIRLNESQLRERLANSGASRLGSAYVQTVQDLVDCVIADRPDSLREKLRRAAANLGTKRFVTEVAAPFLSDLGEAWFEGIVEVQQEHLASEVLLAQIHAMAASYEYAAGPTIVMATLPREAHSLGLMLVALYMAASDAHVLMLGTDTPVLQIVQAARALNADAVAISISSAAATAAVREQVDVLAANLDKATALWLGGKGALRLDAPPTRALCLNHWDEIDDALSALGSRSIPK